MTVPFVHLHCHSHYSFYNGTASPEALVRRAKELNMPALALTDYCNLHGIPEFCRAANRYDIKPIIGCELRVAAFDPSDGNAASNLTLLVMNEQGWRNLICLSSLSFGGESTVDKDMLLKHNAGLICLSGFAGGEIGRLLLKPDGYDSAKIVADQYHEMFGDRFYLELRNHDIDGQESMFDQTIVLGRELCIPTVATTDIHYLRREEWKIHDMLLCIKSDKRIFNTDRPRMDSNQHYFRNGDEMYDAFQDNFATVERTLEIAERIEPKIYDRFYEVKHHPTFSLPASKTADEVLHELCIAGIEKRHADSPYIDEAKRRLDSELAVIRQLGFADYFLVLNDLARFFNERNILYTACISAPGSVVCYLLFLSHECPVEYGLLFERFVEKIATSLPDVYIDIDATGPDEHIHYLRDKYGKSHVAKTAVFHRMSAYEAVYNTGLAIGLPIYYVKDVASKFSVGRLYRCGELKRFCAGDEVTADRMSLYQRYKADPELAGLLDAAQHLECLPFGFMQGDPCVCSAAALVISDSAINGLIPLQYGDESNTLQWEKDEIALDSFLQVNVSSTKDLTTIARTITLIRERNGIDIDPYRLPLDNWKTFAMIRRGKTSGIGQLDGSPTSENRGMRAFLCTMNIDNFRDIIAALALYRPGPLSCGMEEQYDDVKSGKKYAKYAHPTMEDILGDTYGVMLYQEQMMQILHRLGGIPLDETYKCIKAIVKKRPHLIANFRERFVASCRMNGLTDKIGEEIFEQIERLAPHGFCKAHATAYARIAYIAAYLKAHFPDEFATACRHVPDCCYDLKSTR